MPSIRLIRPVLALVVVAAMVAPALAHPPAPVTERERVVRGKLHAWIHQAKVPLVSGRIQIRRRACPGRPSFDGCVFSERPRVLYLKQVLREPRRLLYHELGPAGESAEPRGGGLQSGRSAPHRLRARRTARRPAAVSVLP
jgi:hypothetical protein